MTGPEREVIDLELETDAGAIRVVWDPDVSNDEREAQWRLQSEPDWNRLDGIRLISARFDDGAMLGVASARLARASGHDDDVVAARLIEADGHHADVSEPLVSIEYDGAGVPRRLGLELWPATDGPPLRIAADRISDAAAGIPGGTTIPMTFRRDGIGGSGRLQVLSED